VSTRDLLTNFVCATLPCAVFLCRLHACVLAVVECVGGGLCLRFLYFIFESLLVGGTRMHDRSVVMRSRSECMHGSSVCMLAFKFHPRAFVG